MSEKIVGRTELVSTLAKPGQQILDTMNAARMHRVHMVVGIFGEVGEQIDGVLNYNAEMGKDAPNFNEVRKNIVEELGDILFYTEGLMQSIGLTLEETTQQGFELEFVMKYLDKYDNERVINWSLNDRISVIAGRIADVVKKEFCYNQELKEGELSDHCRMLYICCADFMNKHSIDRADVEKSNYEKLKERYDGLKYSDRAAQKRADKLDE